MQNFIQNQSKNRVFPRKHWFFHCFCFVWNWFCLIFGKNINEINPKSIFPGKNMFFFSLILNWYLIGKQWENWKAISLSMQGAPRFFESVWKQPNLGSPSALQSLYQTGDICHFLAQQIEQGLLKRVVQNQFFQSIENQFFISSKIFWWPPSFTTNLKS